jgi:2-polyprenyl-6-methoxyphenol hydroxylase-like FAD-dependent oxidoreductase
MSESPLVSYDYGMRLNNTASGPRVAVVGGGIGGLAAAVLLERAGLSVIVAERDAGPSKRDQGGSIAIDAALGRPVIERMGLAARFAEIAHPEATAFRMRNRDGAVLFNRDADPSGNDAEVERGELHRMLREALPSGTTRWGSRLTALDWDDGRARLRYADGSTDTADVVVGADGAWSGVRALLTPTAPTYSGMTFLDRRFPEVDERYPDVAAVIGTGSTFVFDSGAGLVMQRVGRNARAYLAFRAPAEQVRDADAAAVLSALTGVFDGWSSEYAPLLKAESATDTVRPVFHLPAGFRWDRQHPVTLLGDAAHLQSPFCGLGTNGALLDAADLVDAFEEHDVVDVALAQYESRMWARAAAYADASSRSFVNAFGDRTAADMQSPPEPVNCRPTPTGSELPLQASPPSLAPIPSVVALLDAAGARRPT